MDGLSVMGRQSPVHLQSQPGLYQWTRQYHVAVSKAARKTVHVRRRELHATWGVVAKDWRQDAAG